MVFKQYVVIISQFWWIRILDIAYSGPLLTVSSVWKDVGGLHCHLETWLGTPKFTQAFGKMYLLAVVWLSSQVPCWMSARDQSHTLEASDISPQHGLLYGLAMAMHLFKASKGYLPFPQERPCPSFQGFHWLSDPLTIISPLMNSWSISLGS